MITFKRRTRPTDHMTRGETVRKQALMLAIDSIPSNGNATENILIRAQRFERFLKTGHGPRPR